MKKFIALAAVVLVSMATTTMYAQESRAEKRADRKAQRDAERARLKAEENSKLAHKRVENFLFIILNLILILMFIKVQFLSYVC